MMNAFKGGVFLSVYNYTVISTSDLRRGKPTSFIRLSDYLKCRIY